MEKRNYFNEDCYMHSRSISKRLLERFSYDEGRREHYALVWVDRPGGAIESTQRTLVRFRVEFRPEGFALVKI
ncbi:hypothetical protein [Paraburkholderia azotifigens]|uniref:Uncharacterized protein n=1 Tax=Paraburkholderia azotifigens TaxID=2057004 RepID=A0ABU9R3Q5_9BURK